MAKYVLIEFDDDATADGFIATVPVQHTPEARTTTMRLVAVYKKPTQYCTCKPQSDKSAVGRKYGWHICPTCGKPHEGIWQSPANLLRPDERRGRRELQLSLVEPQPEEYEKI